MATAQGQWQDAMADAAVLVSPARLEHFVAAALRAAGTADEAAGAVARALASTSLRGVDSHGVRLLPHYLRVVEGGRVKGRAKIAVETRAPVAAVVDADDGFGHPASYRAVAEGCRLAAANGLAMVSVVNSSHFGAAGCYALEAAGQGMIAFAFGNSDSFVLPHDGVAPFHGTTPIAFAAPVRGERPYLIDMATSIVPWNRVQDYRSKGMPVPEDVAVDAAGRPTTEPADVAALLPLGGRRYGFKGAALASLAEILSAIVTGMPYCAALLPMAGPDVTTPRHLGHFFIVMRPDVLTSLDSYEAGMAAYLADLRRQPAQPGSRVMAPGDREWATLDQRNAAGIPVAPALLGEFAAIAERYRLEPIA